MFGTNLFSKNLIIFLYLVTLSTLVTSFTCETPDAWLTGDPIIQRRARGHSNHIIATRNTQGTPQIWPNGIVKYKFNHTLTLEDMAEVHKAFAEYHAKTCIRFEPWEEGDINFISIEVDDRICGKANVCKLGGYQFVRFGGNCRNMFTMIHELGHALCFGHEHQRLDRDNHIEFKNCAKRPRRVKSVITKGLYDYGSQMHYECNWCRGGWPTIENVTKCGQEATTGLSLLDVDAINSFYDCQGCKRHRWIPLELLTHENKANMYTFGQETVDGSPMYVCRALVRWEYAPGIFDYVNKTCKVSWGWDSHEITDYVEILTIPGGLMKDCSIYKLADKNKVMFEDVIQAGASFKREYQWTTHIAYGTIADKKGKVLENSIGKVWVENGESMKDYHAEIPFGSACHKMKKFKVLTCELVSKCSVERLLVSRRHNDNLFNFVG